MEAKINCKWVDNNWGGLIFFVKSSFSEEEIESILKEESFNYIGIVLLEHIKIDIVEMLVKTMQSFSLNIDLCFCGDATNVYIDELLNLKKICNLRSIKISINNIYCLKETNEIHIGLEKWSNGETPDLLANIDTPVAIQADDIFDLQPYVLDVIDWMTSYSPQSDLEKIVLFDCWMQENVQYIKGRESQAADGVYICESMQRESRAEDVLKNHFGRCEDIAFTASMILNHPAIGISCRQVSSDKLCHSWNIVSCDGKEYYCDFTHNITRNPCKIPGALKAKQYSCTHTLMGKNDALNDYGISDYYDCTNIANISYSREKIKQAAERLFGHYPLEFSEEVIINSYLKEN